MLLQRERALLARRDGPFARAICVDFGVGEWPWTTLELATLLQSLDPRAQVVGVDADRDRVRHARRYAREGVEFREGSFDLPLSASEPVRLVRAMNVLREYGERESYDAHRRLAAALLPGGLLVEGTSSRAGGVACAHLLRRREHGLEREALLFLTDFTQGFAPWLFRDRLPRDLRRSARRGSVIHAFFAAWWDAFAAARGTGLCEPVALFAMSALGLARRLPGIDCDPALIERGALLWRPAAGVPIAHEHCTAAAIPRE